MSQIGVEEREQLETISVRVIVKKHRRLKYACRCCKETITLAKGPFEAIEKGIAGSNLLAQVLVDKYGDHLPLYRQEQRFKRHGLQINRSTYLIKIAKLGGYLARSSDPPPGNTVMWRGMFRLIGIELGFRLAMKVVGN